MTHFTPLLTLWCVFVLMVGTGVWARDVLGGIGLKMDCVSSNTSASVEWCKKEQCGDDDPAIECWEQNTLQIENVSYHKDKGCYLCMDQDTNETLHNESFNIYETPKRVWLTDKTSVPLVSVAGRLGDVVSLACNVPCSNPEPRVLWEDSNGISIGNGSLMPEGECNYTSAIDVKLTPGLAGNTIKCLAQNIAMWPPVSAASEVILTPRNVIRLNLWSAVLSL
ncbi:uncharacterized protein LOC135471066 [Liolophura sinensis]|uniref:uncharacterized protein LOC135471066 n=1 Tax=Liolophura sinensis TaxID=3198878 RepID=UPI003159257F